MGSVRLNNGQIEIEMDRMAKEEKGKGKEPKDYKDMLRQDIEAEYSDWYSIHYMAISEY